MRMIRIILLLLTAFAAGLVTQMAVWSKHNSTHLDRIMGKLARASLRFPPLVIANAVEQDLSLDSEEIFTNLRSGPWAALSKMERAELLFYVLLYDNQLQGGSILSLAHLLNDEDMEALQFLKRVDKGEVLLKTGWTETEYSSFLSRISWLETASPQYGKLKRKHE